MQVWRMFSGTSTSKFERANLARYRLCSHTKTSSTTRKPLLSNNLLLLLVNNLHLIHIPLSLHPAAFVLTVEFHCYIKNHFGVVKKLFLS